MTILNSIIALIVIALTISCSTQTAQQQAPKEKPLVKVDVIIAGYSNYASNIEVNGSVISNELVELRPEISGRLTYLNIPDGGKVTKGTVLAKINDADLQAQLSQYKLQLELAEKTKKRLKDLLAINGVNQAEYDAALNQVNIFRTSADFVHAQIDKTVIRAPFSGQLGLRQVSPGAYVTPQTILGSLGQTDKIKIDFAVPETYISMIQNGNKVKIKLNDKNDSLTAIISAIDPQINSITRNIKARAFLEAGNIAPGSFVKVLLDQNRKAMLIPTNSIIPEAFLSQVVLVKNGKAIFKTVETNLRNSNTIEITSGIDIGDTLVVSGMLYVRPNTKVTIKNIVALESLN